METQLRQQIPFRIFSFSILIAFTLPTLIKDGMFMDAMLYTSVSHNLSKGIGTFWFPIFSVQNVGGLRSFHEQPPLVFGIQALFFRIFGDSLYVERLYTFITMCTTAFLITKLWKQLTDKKYHVLGWLPLILWITIPVCFWTYSNNMHENTMGIFTLASAICIVRGIKMESKLLLLSGGAFVFLATMSKGIPGFFPVAIPFIYFLIYDRKNFSKFLIAAIFIILVPVILYSVLWNFADSRESLSNYLFKRAFYRINENPTTDSRFFILIRLLSELIPQISVVIIFYIISKIKRIRIFNSAEVKGALFLFCVGLSASAPIMFTLVQKGFYFVPALPFFALGFAVLIAPVIYAMTEKIIVSSAIYKNMYVVSLITLAGILVISFLQIGKYSRNKELLHDVYLVGNNIPYRSTVNIPSEQWNQWDLQCYLARYFCISLETNFNDKYSLLDKTSSVILPANYQKINLPTLKYDLYERK